MSRFTMVELIVTLSVMVVLMALAMPSLRSVIRASGVDTGANLIASEMRMARQRAVTSGKFVAVLLPTTEDNGDGGFSAPTFVSYKGSAYRTCYLTGAPLPTSDGSTDVTWYTGKFDRYVENSQWRFLPQGTFVGYTDTFGPFRSATMTVADHSCNVVSDLIFPESTSPLTVNNVRAVIFRPNGSVLANPRYSVDTRIKSNTLVQIQAGILRPDNSLLLQGDNYVQFLINRFSGKVQFVDRDILPE